MLKERHVLGLGDIKVTHVQILSVHQKRHLFHHHVCSEDKPPTISPFDNNRYMCTRLLKFVYKTSRSFTVIHSSILNYSRRDDSI